MEGFVSVLTSFNCNLTALIPEKGVSIEGLPHQTGLWEPTVLGCLRQLGRSLLTEVVSLMASA